jgi:hypothetical protein
MHMVQWYIHTRVSPPRELEFKTIQNNSKQFETHLQVKLSRATNRVDKILRVVPYNMNAAALEALRSLKQVRFCQETLFEFKRDPLEFKRRLIVSSRSCPQCPSQVRGFAATGLPLPAT